MRRLLPESEPPFDFHDYLDTITKADYAGYESDGSVTYVYEDEQGRYQHVLLNSQDPNVFMVVVLDMLCDEVHGHRLLNLRQLYGFDESGDQIG